MRSLTRHRKPAIPGAVLAGLMAAAWAAAFWAQGRIDDRTTPYLAGALYATAAMLFAVLVRHVPLGSGPNRSAGAGEHEPAEVGEREALKASALESANASTLEPADAGTLRRPSLFAAGLVLGFGSVVLFDANRFTAWNLAPWLGGIGLCLWAFRPVEGDRGPRASWRARLAERRGVTVDWEWLALAAIVLAGLALRLYRLDAIPGEKWGDLGFHYADVRAIWGGDWQIYFADWGGGREPIFFYLMAALTRLFGFTSTATKFLSAVIGTATIAALYLWARELFGRNVGLVAALLLGLGKWHLILSRSSFRSSLLPLAVCLVGYSLAQALRSRRPVDYARAGVWLGLALYTYPSSLGVPIAAAGAVAAVALLGGLRPNRRRVANVACMALMAGMVLVPLARTVYERPINYIGRGSLDDPGNWLGPGGMTRPSSEVIRTYADRARRALLQYHYEGNSYGYYMIPFERHMGRIDAVLLAFGLAYCLLYARRGLNVMPPVFGLAMLVPPVLVALPDAGWATNAVRSSGTIPAVTLMAALPVALLPAWIERTLGRGRWGFSLGIGPIDAPARRRIAVGVRPAWLAPVAVAGLFIAQFRDTREAYFHRYPKAIEWANYPLNLEMARLVREFEANANGQAFIKQWPYWYDIFTVRAALDDWDWKRDVADLGPVLATPGNVLVLVHPDDAATIDALKAAFPRHAVVTHRAGDARPVLLAVYGMR